MSPWELLGIAGDTALGICVLPAMDLLLIGRACGELQFPDGANKALDYYLHMQRPEGGDFWETPLHRPNLLAAGHAAVAYYLAFEQLKNPQYLAKAVHWIRCLLPFTHLWQPSSPTICLGRVTSMREGY